MTGEAAAPQFRLEGEGLPADLTVLSFRGRETIGRPYRVDVVLALPSRLEPARIASSLLEHRVVLALSTDARARRIAGLVESVAFAGALDLERYALRVRVVPGLSLLRFRRTSRVYQDLTVPDVIAAVLHRHRLPLRTALVEPHAVREYCVQYRETDLDFVLRLASEEGLVLHFEDPEPGANEERVVIGDSPAASRSILGEPRLAVLDGALGQALGHQERHLDRVVVERRAGTRGARVEAYDPMRPQTRIRSAAHAEEGGPLEAPRLLATDAAPEPTSARLDYEHHADYERIEIHRGDAAVHLAQRRRRALTLAARSACLRLAAGHRFTLEDLTPEGLPTEWTLVGVDHRGDAAELEGGRLTYEARLRAIPASVTPRPRASRRPPIQVAETGVIVGPPGDEVHTDPHGRVKVRFHWDLEGPETDAASCWIRVAQAWAGESFGMFFLPRVGMEVLVTFVGGDPDKPLVTGALHHAAHPPPFRLPPGKLVSGLVTRTSPGGNGSHELTFDDSSGKELLHMSSQRDLEIRAKHDARFDVARDRADTVGRHLTEVVHGDRHALADGASARHVGGDDSDLVRGDRATITMGKTTGHSGGPVAWQLDAGGALTSRGPLTTQVQGDHTLIVGTGHSVAQTSVTGRYAVGASDMLTLRSEKGILLEVGTTRLMITRDGIKLNGDSVSLKADKIVAQGDGPTLTLGDEAELVAKKLTLYSRNAALELTDDAELRGSKVKLGPPRTAPKPKSDDDKAETKPFQVKLSDVDFEPYAHKHYVVMAEGKRVEGETGGGGEIDVAIPKEATRADITCWIEEYPTGEKRTWSVKLADLPPASTPRGALMRLHNLGYFQGTLADELGAGARAALRWFQKDHDLDQTGELDGDTVSELERVHGS